MIITSILGILFTIVIIMSIFADRIGSLPYTIESVCSANLKPAIVCYRAALDRIYAAQKRKSWNWMSYVRGRM